LENKKELKNKGGEKNSSTSSKEALATELPPALFLFIYF
jgi:hypothetical protein